MCKKTLRGLGLFSLLLILPIFLSAEWLVLGPHNFQCHEPQQADSRYYVSYLRPTNTDTHLHYSAPINLPDGMRIREVTVYYLDNSTGYIRIDLIKHRLYDHFNVYSINDWRTTGSANFARVAVIPGSLIAAKLIKNQSNRYVLRFNFSTADDQLRLYGVKIKATY